MIHDMNPRTTQILEALIQEFILTGEPISSRKLAKKHDFEVKDATIRNELNCLMEEGFLMQPHVSSGRVPSDKGYRFFVEHILASFMDGFRMEVTHTMAALSSDLAHRDFESFVSDVADELQVLGVGYVKEDDTVYKSGLDGLFSRLISNYELTDPQETFEIIKDFEMVDERASDLLNFIKNKKAPQVFIGKSPITNSRQLSVIADGYDVNGDQFVVAAVGPKRMDYGRNIRFFKTLRAAVSK